MDKNELIEYLKAHNYLKSKEIITAFKKIPRENFVPVGLQAQSYEDMPLPIGFNQTISAPHMYAIMLELAGIRKGEKVLEIGCGSGYGAALLSVLVGKECNVYSIEVIPGLAEYARENLLKSKIENVEVVVGNGNFGLKKRAPFDVVIVTAGATNIPKELVKQLKEGGRIVIPVGDRAFQELLFGVKKNGRMKYTRCGEVIFVPLVGMAEESQSK